MNIFSLFGSILIKNDDANKAIDETTQKGEGLHQKLVNGAVKIAAWGAAAVTAAGTAAAAFGTASVEIAASFEQGMANVSTLLTGSAEEIATKVSSMGEDVKRIMMETGTSMEVLQGGLYEVISTFGEGGESIAQLEIATKAAAAGGATAADAIALLGSVTKGYGDTSAEATQKAADLAFQTANLGVTTFPELAASLGAVIPLAATMKVKQEELFGAMATLTGVTGNTSEVTTQLRATIQGFLQPTSDMAKAIKAAGYENGQMMIESLGLAGSLDKLKAGVKGNEIAFANLFGSVEAKGAVLALTGNQADSFAEKTKAMGNAAGASEAAFEKTSVTFQSVMGRLMAGVEVMKVNVGDTLLPILNDGVTSIMDKLPAISESVVAFFGGFADGLATILPQLLDAAVGILPVLMQLADVFITSLLPDAMAVIMVILPLIQEIVGGIAPSMVTLFSAISVLLADAATTLLPPLIAVLNLLIPLLLDVVRQGLGAIIPLMVDIGASVLPVVMELLEALLPFVQQLLDVALWPLVDFVTELIPLAMEIIEAFLPPLISLVNTILPLAIKIIESILPPIINLIEQMIPLNTSIIRDILPIAIKLIETILPPLMKIIDAILPPIIDLATKLLVPAMKIVDAFLPPLLEMAMAFIPPLMEIIEELLPPLIELATTLLDPLFELLDGLLPPLMTVLKWFMDNMFPTVKNNLSAVADIIKGVVGGAISFIQTQVDNAKKYVTDIVDFVTAIFKGDWSTAWNAAKNLVSDIWSGIKNTMRGGVNAIIDALNGFIRGLNRLKIPDWVPGVGGRGFHIDLIPRLMKGGKLLEAGDVLVGDGGPERITLPEGAVVRPLSAAERQEPSGGSLDVDRLIEGLAKLLKASVSITNNFTQEPISSQEYRRQLDHQMKEWGLLYDLG